MKATAIMEALKQAGYELVNKGHVSSKLLDIISQPLVSEEEYRRDQNDDYAKAKNKEKD